MEKVDALTTTTEFRICGGLGQGYVIPSCHTKILIQDGYLVFRGMFVGFCVRGKTKSRYKQENRSKNPVSFDFDFTTFFCSELVRGYIIRSRRRLCNIAYIAYH
jgi:hypothetical protein